MGAYIREKKCITTKNIDDMSIKCVKAIKFEIKELIKQPSDHNYASNVNTNTTEVKKVVEHTKNHV